MKKTYRLFCMMSMAAVLALMSSSCKKNEQNGEITISVPEFQQVMGEPSEANRAYIDFTETGNTFHWNAYDEVMVYNLDANEGTNTKKAVYRAKQNAEGKPTAKFYFDEGDQMGSKLDHFFIFYPTCRIVNGLTHLDKDNFETFDVPTHQNYTVMNGAPTMEPSAMAMACEVDKLTKSFMLKHINGGFLLGLKGEPNTIVDSIQIVDNINLTGNVSLKLHEVEMQTFQDLMDNYTIETLGDGSFLVAWNEYRERLGYNSQPTGKMVTLNCHSNDKPYGVDGVELNLSSHTNFYLSLRPGSLINGFLIYVYYNGLDTPQVITNYNHAQNSYCISAGYCNRFFPEYVVIGRP